MPALFRAAVDIGGTFSDIQVLELATGRTCAHKTPTTPDDPSEGLIRGLCEIAERVGFSLDCIEQLLHGTTIATNAVIEYDGAEVGMLTTRGFRDVLHMARHKRPHNFSMQFDVPWQSKPLVRRRNRIPISERILPPDGRIEVNLNEEEVRAAAQLFKERSVDAVIICFIFSM